MKKIITALITIVMFVFGTAIVVAAPQKNSIGIIDVERIMSESPRVQVLQDQLLQVGKGLNVQLNAEKANLSSEEYNKKQETVVQEYQLKKLEFESQINLSFKKAIDKVAKEKNISVILAKNSVMCGGTDITNDIISSMQ